jgi:hypothetical protein
MRSREIADSMSTRTPAILAEVFRGSPHSSQESVWVVCQIRPRSLLIHESLMILHPTLSIEL